MKRAIFSAAMVVLLVGLTGCMTQHGRRPWACLGGSCAQAPENCQSCNDPDGIGRCRECGGRGCRLCQGRAQAGAAGGAMAYPYYTVRGPRDFYAKSPSNIGP